MDAGALYHPGRADPAGLWPAADLPKPKINWFTWLLYNGGLIILPIVDRAMIITGGTLIFTSVIVLMKDQVDLRREAIAQKGRGVCSTYSTTRFYLDGVDYLLVGVLVGTGMWIGWAGPLHIAIPMEVQVYTNLWGYTVLISAGLIYDLFHAVDLDASFLGKTVRECLAVRVDVRSGFSRAVELQETHQEEDASQENGNED